MKIWILLYLSLVVCGYGFATLGPWWLPLIPAVLISAWWTGGHKQYVSRRAKKDYSHSQHRLTASAGFLVSGLALMTVWLGMAFLLANQDSTGLVAKVGSLFGGSLPFLAQVSASGLVYTIIGILSFLLGGLAGYAGVRLRH
jgi:hypothetical protein